MYAQVEKAKDNKSRVVANSAALKKSNEKKGFGLVDNRSDTMSGRGIVQRAISKRNATSVAKDVVDNHKTELKIEWTIPDFVLTKKLHEINYGVIATALRAGEFPETPENVELVGNGINQLLGMRKIKWLNPDQDVLPDQDAVVVNVALNNIVNYDGVAYELRNILIDKVYTKVGSKKNIGQALNRMDGGNDVSKNDGIKRAAGGKADAQTHLLQAALHCSFGMDQDGCTFFFTQVGTNITIVGLGFHVNNSSKQYEIVWASPGYPTGRFDLP